MFEDIKAVVRAAQGRPVKVIRTTMLERDEKIVGCTLLEGRGCGFRQDVDRLRWRPQTMWRLCVRSSAPVLV